MARGALVRLQARDGSRTSGNEPSLACRASASITGCVRKSLLRLRPSAYLTRDHRLVAAITLRLKTKMQAAKTPTVSPRLAPSGAGARRVFLRSICARRCSIDSLNLVRDKNASRKCRAANWESRHLGGVTKLQRFHRGSFAATQISPRFHRSTASGFWYNVHVPREWGYGAKGRNPMHRKTICAAKRSSREM